jgi:predicted ArsR family transcriptional regulator
MRVPELLLADQPAAPALREGRARVLAVLQEAGGPVSVSDVAKRVGLHSNTARFHLDALVEAGMAERAAEDREQPGRPRNLYTARAESARLGRRSYRLLAEILTSYIAAETPRPAQAGLEAGNAWGRYLAERPPPFQQVDADSALDQLVGALETIGFEPEATASGRSRQILLHHCPFLETAEEHRDVVCAIHLGLMQGLLAELKAPVNTDRLDPFVAPNLCVANVVFQDGDKTVKRRKHS